MAKMTRAQAFFKKTVKAYGLNFIPDSHLDYSFGEVVGVDGTRYTIGSESEAGVFVEALRMGAQATIQRLSVLAQ